MSSVFTTSPIGTSLELSASTRQTGVSSGEIAVRKFPNIQENFLDAPAQKDLETRLEEFIAKTGALQSKVIFYNQRFQKQDPKLVKNWEGEYLEHLEKDEETFKEYTYSVQGLTKDMDQRTHLLQQRIQDMQFLQTLFHQEWEGTTSSFSLGFSLIPTWQTRYGVSYRMSQVKSYVEARKKETTLQKEISRSGETPILSPATLVSGKDKESGELNYERVFAKLQDLIMRAVVLKEYIFVYIKTLDKQPHQEVARSAYLKMLENQDMLQKKFKTNEESIKNAKESLEKQLTTARFLDTPDVALLGGELRKLEILQG